MRVENCPRAKKVKISIFGKITSNIYKSRKNNNSFLIIHIHLTVLKIGTYFNHISFLQVFFFFFFPGFFSWRGDFF
ncbi:hypothetical protein GDO86_005247 [Hymenochirus boettgeri]|uniref:Uncharacterized protein n=1 Tax=Hymenochirus boettgeri TaxID=247094 RepID=A0A8T2J193_9PIPI|nr:hypothetical protein GDO86_005247 [Hymenochirus boettgeri]